MKIILFIEISNYKNKMNIENKLCMPLPKVGVYTIYTKKDCIYCTKVKKLLETEKVVVVECDSYLEKDREYFLKTMDSLTGKKEQRTFPFVFKHSLFLGGYDDTVLYEKLSFSDEF